MEEMMLGANIKVQESDRFVWKPESKKKEIPVKKIKDDFPEISLQPMQIRTFVITVNA